MLKNTLYVSTNTDSGHYYVDRFEDEDDIDEPDDIIVTKTKNLVVSQCIYALISDLRRCGRTATKRMLLDNLTTFLKECDDFYAPFIAVKAHPEKWQIKLYTITDAPDPHKIWVYVALRFDNIEVERRYKIADSYCSDRHMKTVAFLQELTESLVSTVNRRETLYKKTRLNAIYGANASTTKEMEKEIIKYMNNKKIEDYIQHDMEATKKALMPIYRKYALNDLVKKVYFNKPYTVVIWINGDKTIVKCQKGEKYDPEKGLAMCFAKFLMGNDSFYYEVFKKYLPEKKAAPKKTASKKEAADKE